MKNVFTAEKLAKFKSLIENSERIALVGHTNPDGDAVGSTLALSRYIKQAYPGKIVRIFVPNRPPAFLGFIDGDSQVEVYAEMIKEAQAFLAAADMIVCMDFNLITRLDQMGDAIEMNLHATRVLVDHHIAPPHFELSFHNEDSCSTALLTYHLIVGCGGEEALTKEIGEPLYLGMMTDTGGFSFSRLDGDLFRAVASLIDCGVDAVDMHQKVFSQQSEDRLRLVGYLLDEKMVVRGDKSAAYISLTQEEKDRFNYQIGDGEGVVNMPLSIDKVNFSVMMTQTKEHIKLSLRSQGELDVNLLAREHFMGGGHKNAAGGKFFGEMDEAIAKVEQVINSLV